MDSFPTPSVTGQQDWEWNRLLEDRSAGDQSQRAAPTERRPPSAAPPARRATASNPSGSDAPTVEVTPEREDQQLQSVITRYERLLDEKNRQLAEATEEHPAVEQLSSKPHAG